MLDFITDRYFGLVQLSTLSFYYLPLLLLFLTSSGQTSFGMFLTVKFSISSHSTMNPSNSFNPMSHSDNFLSYSLATKSC